MPFSGARRPWLSCHLAVCDSGSRPGFRMCLPEGTYQGFRPALLFQLFSLLIQMHLVVSLGPLAGVPVSDLALLLPRSPLSLKGDWVFLLTPALVRRQVLCCLHIFPVFLLHLDFPMAAGIVGSGMRPWFYPSLTVNPCQVT